MPRPCESPAGRGICCRHGSSRQKRRVSGLRTGSANRRRETQIKSKTAPGHGHEPSMSFLLCSNTRILGFCYWRALISFFFLLPLCRPSIFISLPILSFFLLLLPCFFFFLQYLLSCFNLHNLDSPFITSTAFVEANNNGRLKGTKSSLHSSSLSMC